MKYAHKTRMSAIVWASWFAYCGLNACLCSGHSLHLEYVPSQSFLVQMGCRPFSKAKFNDPSKLKRPIPPAERGHYLF